MSEGPFKELVIKKHPILSTRLVGTEKNLFLYVRTFLHNEKYSQKARRETGKRSIPNEQSSKEQHSRNVNYHRMGCSALAQCTWNDQIFCTITLVSPSFVPPGNTRDFVCSYSSNRKKAILRPLETPGILYALTSPYLLSYNCSHLEIPGILQALTPIILAICLSVFLETPEILYALTPDHLQLYDSYMFIELFTMQKQPVSSDCCKVFVGMLI